MGTIFQSLDSDLQAAVDRPSSRLRRLRLLYVSDRDTLRAFVPPDAGWRIHPAHHNI